MTNTANSQLLEAERRSWDYWFSDGIATIVSGCGCLSLAIFLVWVRHRSPGAVPVVLLVLLVVLYGVVLLGHKQIIEWLKSKITYPRTGYSAPPYFAEDSSLPLDFVNLSIQGADAKRPSDVDRVRRDRNIRAIFVAVLCAGVALLALLVSSPWICGAVGVVIGGALWFFGRKDQRLSWIVLVGFPFLGFYLTVFQVAREERLGYFLLGAALLLILEGLLALAKYLRRNPRQEAPQA